jgi:nucleoside diphosphate kinase
MCVARRGIELCQNVGAPCDNQPKSIAEIVPRVGQQGDRMRGDTIKHLDRNQPHIQSGRNRKHRTEVFGRMRVPMAAVIVAAVVMTVMIVFHSAIQQERRLAGASQLAIDG